MRIGSVRARTTTAAVLIVGLALAAAGVGLLLYLKSSLENDVEAAARLRAFDYVALLDSGTSPADLDIRLEDDVLVQVVAADGSIVAGSPFLEMTRPLANVRAGKGSVTASVPGEDDRYLIVAEKADEGTGVLTVLVARSLEPINETTGAATVALLAGIPLLLLVTGVTTWVIVGRALEPVEAIRSEVASISAGNASTPVGRARVPVPAGDDEIARLASTMNEMLDRLGATQERLQQVVADASHELRNPVAALRQSAEAALAHPESTNVQELAAEVLEESLRLQTAAEDLLLLARLDAAPKIPFAPVDLDDIVFATAKDLRKTATIDVDTSAVSAVRTIGDAWQLRRLVANLAANAGRHAATKVVFTLRRVGQEGVLHVDDDGEGIPAERREQVFERFARLDEARDRVHGGAGLGLAIVFAIATAHGGSVAALASPLGGARIEVVLPVDPL